MPLNRVSFYGENYASDCPFLTNFMRRGIRIDPRGVLPNFQYGGGSVPIFGVRKFTLNQYLGSVNYNMDKNSYLGCKNLTKGRIVEFVLH